MPVLTNNMPVNKNQYQGSPTFLTGKKKGEFKPAYLKHQALLEKEVKKQKSSDMYKHDMKRNVVFSVQPDPNVKSVNQPVPAFTGNIRDKRGVLTQPYKKWVNDNKNKPFFKALDKQSIFDDTQKTTVKSRDVKTAATKTQPKKVITDGGVVRVKPAKQVKISYTHVPSDDTGVRRVGQDTIAEAVRSLNGVSGIVVIKFKARDGTRAGINFQLDFTGDIAKDIEKVQQKLLLTSTETFFDQEYAISGTTEWQGEINIFSELKSQGERIDQIYAGANLIGTCVIDPIVRYYENILENSTNPAKSLPAQIKKYENKKKKYPNGMTIEDITTLAMAEPLRVKIYTVTGTLMHDIDGAKLANKSRNKIVFSYVNTNLNHLEGLHGHFLLFNDDTGAKSITLNHEEIEAKKAELISGGFPFTYQKSQSAQGTDTTRFLHTFSEGRFTLHNDLTDTIKKFYELNPKICKIYSEHEGDVGHFINSATFVNGIYSFNPCADPDLVEHDQNKAYATFYESAEYEHFQFPRCPTDFCRCENEDTFEIISKTGWTQVTEIDGSSANSMVFELACLVDNCVRPNCELFNLWKHGIRFKATVTAWSLKTFDFRFSEELLEKVKDGSYKDQKGYAVLGGQWLGHRESGYLSYNYGKSKFDESFFNNLKSYDTTNMSKLYHDINHHEVLFRKTLPVIRHYNHLGSYLTAYVRNRMYDKISTMKRDDLYSVHSDAFKIFKTDLNGNEVEPYILTDGYKWKLKDIRLSRDSTTYINPKEIRNVDHWKCATSFKCHGAVVCYDGAGGTGKTHSFINDDSLQFKVCAFPTNELKSNTDCGKIPKYTHHGVCEFVVKEGVTSCTRSFDKIACGNLFVDERTMLTPDCVERLLKTDYPGRLIFAGDSNPVTGMIYQLHPVNEKYDETPFKKLPANDRVNFTEMHRTDDPRLKEILLKLRAKMDSQEGLSHTIDGGNVLAQEFLADNLRENRVSFDTLIEEYADEDFAIASTNVMVDKINQELDKRPELIKKWRCSANGGTYAKGTIITGDKPTQACDLSFCTTINKVQGRTVRSRLWISCEKMFGWGSIYTAISRCITLEDIKIVI